MYLFTGNMGSWKCSLCETEERWPTKNQAMEHIRENHLETLLRASLERSDKEPNQELNTGVHSPVEKD